MSILQLKQMTADGRKKVWKIDSKENMVTFGTSRKSDIVSIDQGVSPFEAALEYRDDGWHLIQFNTSTAIPDQKISQNLSVQIGQSSLEFSLVEKDEFVQPTLEAYSSKGSEQRKILLVTKNGRLLQTEVKPTQYKFSYAINGKKHPLPFKGSTEWEHMSIEGFDFKSKFIQVDDLKNLAKMSSDQLADRESKRMLFMTLGAMAFFIAIGLLAPKKQLEVVEIPIQTASNVIIKMDKTKMEKMKKSATAKPAQQAPAPQQAAAPKETAPAAGGSKVAAMLKGAVGARISQLMGKVSATEARTANVLVTSAGIKAGEGASGRALAAVGKVESSGRNWNGEAVGSGAGVGTAGVGGGKGTAGLANGLAAGKTGSGGVGLIEEESEVVGGLDREVIAQYIKTQLGQILYCYERQLSATPEIHGKVAVKFTISGTGQVESQLIGDSTLQSKPVEGCILNKVAKWKFPEPKGGTKVVVTYPFLFNSRN